MVFPSSIWLHTSTTRYVALIVELGSVSIKLSEYRVLCLRAIEQVGGNGVFPQVRRLYMDRPGRVYQGYAF